MNMNMYKKGVNMKSSISIGGKDKYGDKSFISVSKENGKIYIYSPEDASDVVFTTKQAKELIKAIEKCIEE